MSSDMDLSTFVKLLSFLSFTGRYICVKQCPKDWIPWKDYCYLPILDKLGPFQAQEDCKGRVAEGVAHLMYPESAQELAFINTTLCNPKPSSFYIGLKAEKDSLSFFNDTELDKATSDMIKSNIESDYYNLEPTETEFCYLFGENKKGSCGLYSVACYENQNNTNFGYICETPSQERCPTVIPPANGNMFCPPEYVWPAMIKSGQEIICTIVCDEGFKLYGQDDTLRCKDIENLGRSWTEIPQCVRSCPPPYEFDNAKMECPEQPIWPMSGNPEESTACSVTCDQGYQLLEPQLKYQCIHSKEKGSHWSILPVCTKTCPTPITPANSVLECPSMLLWPESSTNGRDATCKVKCDKNYRVEKGTNTLTCVHSVKNETQWTASPVCTFSCEKGHYAKNETCIPCPKDYYKDFYGVTECKPCPIHHITLSEGIENIKECAASCPKPVAPPHSKLVCHNSELWPSSPGASVSTNCTVLCEDDYKIQGENSSINCEFTAQAGTYWTSGPICVFNCSVGHFGQNEVCRPCPKNYYKDVEGTTSCKPCPAEHITFHKGTGSLKGCVEPCPITMPPNNSQLNCPSGKLWPVADSDNPTACVVECKTDYRLSTTDSTTQCHFNKENGSHWISAAECVLHCGKGYYGDHGKCKPCHKDFYKDVFGTEPCTPCPAPLGTYHIGAADKRACVEKASNVTKPDLNGSSTWVKTAQWTSGTNAFITAITSTMTFAGTGHDLPEGVPLAPKLIGHNAKVPGKELPLKSSKSEKTGSNLVVIISATVAVLCFVAICGTLIWMKSHNKTLQKIAPADIDENLYTYKLYKDSQSLVPPGAEVQDKLVDP